MNYRYQLSSRSFVSNAGSESYDFLWIWIVGIFFKSENKHWHCFNMFVFWGFKLKLASWFFLRIRIPPSWTNPRVLYHQAEVAGRWYWDHWREFHPPLLQGMLQNVTLKDKTYPQFSDADPDPESKKSAWKKKFAKFKAEILGFWSAFSINF